jgi:hypothetical protein
MVFWDFTFCSWNIHKTRFYTASSAFCATLETFAPSAAARGSFTITMTSPNWLLRFMASSPAPADPALLGRQLQRWPTAGATASADTGRCAAVLPPVAHSGSDASSPPPAGSGIASATSGSLHSGQHAPRRLRLTQHVYEHHTSWYTTATGWQTSAALPHGRIGTSCRCIACSTAPYLLCARLYRHSLQVPCPQTKRSQRPLSATVSRHTGHSPGFQAAASASFNGAARSRSAVGTEPIGSMQSSRRDVVSADLLTNPASHQRRPLSKQARSLLCRCPG